MTAGALLHHESRVLFDGKPSSALRTRAMGRVFSLTRFYQYGAVDLPQSALCLLAPMRFTNRVRSMSMPPTVMTASRPRLHHHFTLAHCQASEMDDSGAEIKRSLTEGKALSPKLLRRIGC